MPLLILRQLPADSLTLQNYLSGASPTAKEVLTNLFLAERGLDSSRPDYFYVNRRDKSFGNNSTLREIIIKSISGIVSHCLEFRGKRVFVRRDSFEKWQELLTFFPPLPLVSYALYKNHGAPYIHNCIECYLKEKIDPNAGHTAIPSPYIPKLLGLIKTEGFYETHVHLNGTTEADHVWLHALENPEDFYAEFKLAFKNHLVKEQFNQIEPKLTPKKVYDRLRLAGRIREKLTLWLCGMKSFSTTDLRRYSNLEALPFSNNDDITTRKKHPLINILQKNAERSSLSLEALFHILCFHKLEHESEKAFIEGYHLYLLILGLFNKLIVQQINQVGFDQFQKITVNEARSSSEKSYRRRFEQLAGSTGNQLAFIEGRFSPKLTSHENIKLLRKILSGYKSYHEQSKIRRPLIYDISLLERPMLRLVAHFIKEKDVKPSNDGLPQIKVRHHKLRLKLEQQVKSLLVTTSKSPLLQKFIVGFDAAANELHTGPEVFAPVYRYLRRRKYNNFTFHVGEDFYHLVSGIRSVYEAIIFLKLEQGNRVGHATAVGIDPKLWLRTMSDGVVLTKGDWLDNLVFAYDLFTIHGLGSTIIAKLKKSIEEISKEIYGYSTTVDTLIAAWKMRDLDPLLFYSERKCTDSLDLTDRTEWKEFKRAKVDIDAFKLFHEYHMGARSSKFYELIDVDMSLFSVGSLFDLQRIVLQVIHQKDIVIESMPTSNVRISLYDDHRDHHLRRWIDNKTTPNPPIICLGTDDPGIFSTNLCNEYSHVYNQLSGVRGGAMSNILKLHNNAKSHVFRKT